MLHPKFKKSEFCDNFHDFFDILVHAHDIFVTPYGHMYGTSTTTVVETVVKQVKYHVITRKYQKSNENFHKT